MIDLTRIRGTVGDHKVDVIISISPEGEAKAFATAIETLLDVYIDRGPSLIEKLTQAMPTFATAMQKMHKAIIKSEE